MPAPASRREDAIRRLPRMHAEAIRLMDAGVSDELIAERLDIEALAVGPLLRIAKAKLAAILRDHHKW
jgi:DNA-directed RNA polymerase specialized sigma24 family protein